MLSRTAFGDACNKSSTDQSPGEKGSSVENEWLALFKTHLPHRYQADSAFVVDRHGNVSDQIDVVIYDRQYTPMLFNNSGVKYVPAESVYAVLEVKQELNGEYITYTGKKIASVRDLNRTSTDVVDIGEKKSPRELTYILGGIVTTDSGWNPPFGDPFKDAIGTLDEPERIDLGISLIKGSFSVDRTDDRCYGSRGRQTRLLHFSYSIKETTGFRHRRRD